MGTNTLFRLPITEDAVAFFMEHAGFSYDPKSETPEEGKRRCAEDLAEAEVYAEAHGWFVDWEPDYEAEISDRGSEWDGWPQYMADVRDEDDYLGFALGGVMFADKGDETSDPYARVVAAELFLDAMNAEVSA